jgi:hypothetical protein
LETGLEFDPFLDSDVPAMDPFAMFDPNFDLNAIDACLEQNLDLGVPMSLY